MEIRRSTYFVLAALLDGPLHGYAIIERAAELSGGEVRLSTGTLFGALDRLVESGLVEAGEEEKVEGRVRRSYTLTQDGHAALAAEAGTLAACGAGGGDASREGGDLMRGLLAFACRAFPRDHRARRSDEVVDTALLAADGSAWRAAREALSLVVAGVRQRLRAESDRLAPGRCSRCSPGLSRSSISRSRSRG